MYSRLLAVSGIGCRAAWVIALTLGFECLGAEPGSASEAMALAAEAARAAEAKDLPAYLEKISAAVELRPDFPQLLINLAAAQVANERPDEAIATLERLAKLGMAGSPEKSEELAALRGRKDFQSVARKLATNAHPKGAGDMAFSLRGVTGLIEGVAWRESSREFLFGDVHGRAVWRRNKDNTLVRFTPESDELLGVFGLAIDESRGRLWAATSAVPAMRGFSPEQEGTTALAEIDLESGAIRRTIPPVTTGGGSPSHLLGDLAVAPDGTVFATDSVGAAIWRLPPDGSTLELAAQGPELLSPQGIVVVADGAALVVADKINGLLRVELPAGTVRRLEAPADTTLIGIDGLAAGPGGDVIGIQNSTTPKRVLRIALQAGGESVAGVTVLEAGHLTMAAPSSGCLALDGDFYFIGNAGWGRPEFSDGKPSAPRPVPVFKTKMR